MLEQLLSPLTRLNLNRVKYLITDDQSHFALVQHGGVESEGLVGDDQDRAGDSQTMLRDEVY